MDEPKEAPAPSLVRDYTLITLVSLLITSLLLYKDGPGLWTLVPLTVGAVAVLGRWSGGPPLFLLSLLVVWLLDYRLTFGAWWQRRAEDSLLSDLMLAVSVLGYVAGHYRLCSAASHAVPPDTRRRWKPRSPRARGRWLLPSDATKRTATRGLGGELLQFLVLLPVFALVASLLWVRLQLEEPTDPRTMPAVLWQFIVVAWLLALFLMIARALLGYVGLARATREESLVYLQDQLWTATRGEQRRMARWLAWGRLRGQRKKEG